MDIGVFPHIFARAQLKESLSFRSATFCCSPVIPSGSTLAHTQLKQSLSCRFATFSVAPSMPSVSTLACAQLKDFLKLSLRDLLPLPINALHNGFLRDSPPSYPVTSCRAGTVVHLVSATGVPVRGLCACLHACTYTRHATLARWRSLSVLQSLTDARYSFACMSASMHPHMRVCTRLHTDCVRARRCRCAWR